ncbi:MAG: hypothetical protein H6582_00115 [Crocinitomicaceae bacterium]|nr:hypothetical protein [Crocinitomicaceae bacterium]
MQLSLDEFIRQEMTPELAVEHIGKLNVWRMDGQEVHQAFTKEHILYIDYAKGTLKIEKTDGEGPTLQFDIHEYENKLRDYVHNSRALD